MFNASSKARDDAETVLEKMDFRRLPIHTKMGIQTSKWKKPLQYAAYWRNLKNWDAVLTELNAGDVLLVQYPLRNAALRYERFLRRCEKKGIRTVALVHDINSLRFTPESEGKMYCRRIRYEDLTFLPAFSKVICHNDAMKEKLVSLGVSAEKLIVLGIFDYLTDVEIKDKTKDGGVIIAGNLSKKKVKYLEYLPEIDCNFNLYGAGYEPNGEKNISYKGTFLPDELLNHLEGGFGLVWDGESKNGCRGGWGDYLRYNNPHKTSLYLSAGFPVIMWKEAALASFISANNCGLLVDSLDELSSLKEIPDEEYNTLCENCRRIAEDIQTGKYLTRAIEQALA